MGSFIVVVGVDWEGRSLLSENLQLIAAFRRKHGDVPMQHFLNAAYYTRPNVDLLKITESIRQALLPTDDHALHLHAWNSLLSAAQVSTRNSPRFLDGPVPGRALDDWEFYPEEGGYDVPIEFFEPDEIDRALKTSQDILEAQGFQRPVSFRAGGWMSGPKVQFALARNKFVADCSAVNASFVTQRFGDIPLCRWLADLWPTIGDTSQPSRVVNAAGSLWQFPNNAALVDYTTTEDLLKAFVHNVTCWRETQNVNWFFSTGFHQETARKFLNRLDEAIDRMKNFASEHRFPLVFTATPQQFLD